ncbi:hypothetical protein L1887_36316 [Cichorium endivia]|nr:hypothetical protein L1887_36316 [Cichorium endivia]
MAEVVVKLESILSQETESANSVVDEERFIYKLRSLFTGKVDATIGSKSDFGVDHKPTIIKLDATIGSKSDFGVDHKPTIIKLDVIQGIFTYAELEHATNGFRKEEYSPALDEFVYKGWVDEWTNAPTERRVGLAMYVRKMEILTWKPDVNLKDVDHPNLVKFLGCCFHKRQLFCAYENISGITLDKYLYGEPGRTSLSWVSRLKIARGAAEGLLYLHLRKQPGYSQFKTNLILVDMDFNAQLLYYAFDSYTFRLNAYYAAPEWFRLQADSFDGLVAWKPPADGFVVTNDVYAFGVVLLEILTRMKVYDDKRPGKENLVKWATPLLADGVNLGIIMDPQLQHNDCPPKGAFKLAQLVSKCLQLKQEERPSMEEILKVLNHCYQEEIKTV